QRTVNLVCRNLKKAESCSSVQPQLIPIVACLFQQTERAVYVGANELLGPVNGTIHVAFRREVNDGARLVIPEQFTHEFPVGDVSMNKPVAPVRQDRLEVADVPGIGEVVQINHGSTFSG